MSEDESMEPSAGAAAAEHSLAASLLHRPLSTDDRPDRRWAYPVWGMVLVSLFILYNGVLLLVHNLPGKGLSKGLHSFFNEKLDMSDYMRATGTSQSWAMFAPNPHRSNMFMRVYVKDKQGETWDVKHDIYGRRTYPYLFYDRMGKINRRIIESKGYQRDYAAWVCREWERTHEGQAAEEVLFVKMWTRIPPPAELWKWANGNPFMLAQGYDPMALDLNEREQNTIRCSSTRQAQIPNYMRERMGLPLAPDNHYRPLQIRTWHDKAESADRQREREEQQALNDEDRGDGT